MRQFLCSLVLVVLLAGCGARVAGTHTVSHDSDYFTDEFDGKKVQFKDWKLTVGDRTIEIPHEKTVIGFETNGNHIRITANDKQIYED